MGKWLRNSIIHALTGRKPTLWDEKIGRSVHDQPWRFGFDILRCHPWVSLYTLITVVACLVSVVVGSGDVFARLGAALVAAGIWFEISAGRRYRNEAEKARLGAFVEAMDRRFEENFDAYAKQFFRHGHKYEHLSSGPTTEVLKSLELSYPRERSMIRFEVFLVVLGTAIWAFGDWFVCSIHTWSFTKCVS